MRPSSRFATPLLCGVMGFGLGLVSWSLAPLAEAQENPSAAQEALPERKTVNISEGTAEKIKQAYEALSIAQAALIQDGTYKPAIRTENPYVVLAGGVDALAELEAGRGVDPVTFAGLHNGQAVDEVLPHLGEDTLGRLTYKGKVVRMYPVERMKELQAQQAAILDFAAGGTGTLGDLLSQ